MLPLNTKGRHVRACLFSSYHICFRLPIWNSSMLLTPQCLRKTSFLQLCFTEKDPPPPCQWSSLLTQYVFRTAYTKMISPRVSPSETMKRLIWKSLWSEVLMKMNQSWLLIITQMDDFFKSEKEITAKTFFYEGSRNSPQIYKHVINNDCLLNFFWVVVTNAFTGSKTTKQ